MNDSKENGNRVNIEYLKENLSELGKKYETLNTKIDVKINDLSHSFEKSIDTMWKKHDELDNKTDDIVKDFSKQKGSWDAQAERNLQEHISLNERVANHKAEWKEAISKTNTKLDGYVGEVNMLMLTIGKLSELPEQIKKMEANTAKQVQEFEIQQRTNAKIQKWILGFMAGLLIVIAKAVLWP